MSRSSTRQVATASTKPARVKTAVCISPDAFRRIGACCIKENMTQSEVIEFLVDKHLSGYSVSVRGGGIKDPGNQAVPAIPAESDDRSVIAGSVNPMANAAG
jgi:hypothetical protein